MSFESFLASFLCLVMAIIMYKICRFYWKKCSKELMQYNNNIYCVDMLFAICCLKILLYYFLPAVTHTISGWKPVLEEKVSPFEVTTLYGLELFSYWIYFKIFWLLIKKKRLQISVKNEFSNQLFVTIMLCLAVPIILLQTTINESSSSSLSYLSPFISKAGVSLAIFVLVLSHRMNKINVLISIFVLLLYAIYALTAGIRSLIMWPALLLMYTAYVFNRRRLKFFLGLGAALLLFLVSFQHVLVATRGLFKGEDSLSKVSMILDANDNSQSNSLFEEIDFRFGAMTTYGVGYLRMVERGYFAGLKPCFNSLWAPIPRSVYPQKPIPCSVYDDSEYGQGMYLSMAEITKNPYSMTEPATAGHAFWELHILGVILFSIIPAIYVYYSLRFFSRFSILAFPLFFVIFKWEYLEPKLWVSAIILQLFQINFIAFLFYLLYKFLNKTRLRCQL